MAQTGHEVVVSGGTISGNTADIGAGIYANKGVLVKVSGNPSFSDNVGLNSDNVPSSGATNGGEAYTQARQDIYLVGEGTPLPLPTLVVNGKITSSPGSIWVWADKENHYKYDKQFAVLADAFLSGGDLDTTKMSAADYENSLRAFRNARDDKATENPNEENYLFGMRGTGKDIIWGTEATGFRRVILRKVVEDYYDSLPGAAFDVYRGSGATDPYVLRHADNTTETLSHDALVFKSTGVFWVGELPFGMYYLHETTVPGSVDQNGSDGWWNFLIVGDPIKSGNIELIGSGGFHMSAQYSSRAAAETAAVEWIQRINTARNSQA